VACVLAAPPYVNFSYTVTLLQLTAPTVNVNVSFAKNPQGGRVATIASGYQSPYYPYDYQLYKFVSDNESFQGTMGWYDQPGINMTQNSCHWSFNQSLADMFDFSSTGWLSQADVTTVGAVTLYTYDCSPNCLSSSLQSTYAYFSSGQYILSTDRTGEFLSLTVASSQSLQFIFSAKPQRLMSIDLDVPAICVEADRCPANTTSTNLIIYRNHGNSTLFKQLDNVNLADVQGEVYWLCDYNAPSPLISKFNLTVSPRWTDYMLCNAGVCDASNYGQHYGIGKQDNAGYDKCVDAPPSNHTCSGSCGGQGTWYAFPQAGRCPPGKPIGTNHCTWLDKYTTVKTITLDCLRNVSYNLFSCYNKTVTDLGNEMMHAFDVCPDVQFFMTGVSVGRDVNEGVLPVRAPKPFVAPLKTVTPLANTIAASTIAPVAPVVPRAPPQ